MVHGKTTFEWHTNDIRVHKSDIQTTCECIWVICKWHTSTKHLYLLFILHVICMLLVYHSYLIVCHFFVTRLSFVCHSYANRMYSFVIRISLCSRMSLVCHSYIFESHSYVTRMYSYVFRMSLVWTRMSFVYVTRMYSYVSRMCFYHEPLNMILVD